MNNFLRKYLVLQKKRFDARVAAVSNRGKFCEVKGAARRSAIHRDCSRRNQQLEKEFAILFSGASDEDLLKLAEYEREEGEFLQELKSIFSVMKGIRKSAQDKLSGKKREDQFGRKKKMKQKHLVN